MAPRIKLYAWEKDGKWGVGATEELVAGYDFETRPAAERAIEDFYTQNQDQDSAEQLTAKFNAFHPPAPKAAD